MCFNMAKAKNNQLTLPSCVPYAIFLQSGLQISEVTGDSIRCTKLSMCM